MILKGKAWKFGTDVDTDVIIPARYLKTSDPQELARHCMEDADPDFARKVSTGDIIVAGSNFGCGSSREHAPWALLDYGFRCLIAPSFADIFYNNCFKNGMLPIKLGEEQVDELFQRTRNTPGFRLKIDLETQTITSGDGLSYRFEVDPFRRFCLLQGLDDIGLTLQNEEKIRQYESAHVL
jgi:3-isopropylmalate/(R)-2-methylmalate dehydratase small subunit